MSKRKLSLFFAVFLWISSMTFGSFANTIHAAGQVKLIFNLNAQGQEITNKFYDLSAWDLNEHWTAQADGQAANALSARYPFLKRVQLMIATGGCYIGYPGCSSNRDLFVNPADRTKLNDYDFTPLLQATANIVRQGLKPYIVTGNVPIKLSSNAVLGPFQVNVRPPADYQEYYNYIKAMGDALVGRFGKEELKNWQFGVLQEFENREMYVTEDEHPASARTEYYKLYDYTAAALQDSLGAENLTIGAHAMAVSPGLWSPLDFIDHAAKGVNYKTGKIGTQLNFLTGSYYDQEPGTAAPASKSLANTIHLLRNRANEAGLTDLKFGIDEGRILQGLDGKPLMSRVVGHSFQGAADARLFVQLQNLNVDWFSMWGMNTEGVWGGIDSVSAHIANLSYKMAGDKQIMPAVSGAGSGGNEVGGIGGYNAAEHKAHLMLYNYNSSMQAVQGEKPVITIKNIAPVKGQTVKVKKWIVDDQHGNYWPSWWQDQTASGLQDEHFPFWSRYSVEAPKALQKPEDLAFWYSKEAGYKKQAELTMIESEATVHNGTLTLSTDLQHHGVVFYEIDNVVSTGGPENVTDELSDWSLAAFHSDGLVFDTGNAELLGDTSRVMRQAPFAGENNPFIVYSFANARMISLSATALYASSNETISNFSFYTSENGKTWTKYPGWKSSDTLINSNLWTKRVYRLSALPVDTRYIKIEFPVEEAYFYSPQLAKIEMQLCESDS
ncbi:hypothetical protein [Paenibacillus sp. GCM10027626]|uniref:GH39 family glycosyl hydrolase n=1 Tax=Paenibacillus sp. GCM10027626 TaxID=3273411 RepID=UPI003630CEA9